MSICHIIKVIRLKRLNSYKMYLNLIDYDYLIDDLIRF